MPWEAKPTAPPYVNLVQQTEALLTGGPDDWIIPFLGGMADVVMDVDEFCRAGPEDCPPLDVLDFASGAASIGSKIGTALTAAQIGAKLGCFARQRLFGVYCWERTTEVSVSRTDTPNGQTLYLLNVDLPETEWLSVNEDWKGPIAKTVGAPWYWARYRKLSGGLNEGRLSVMNAAGARSAWVFSPFNTSDASGWIQGSLGSGLAGETTISACPFWDVSSGPTGAVYTFEIRAYGSNDPGPRDVTTPYTPPTVVQPPSAIPPTMREYADLTDIGRRLDAIDNQLRWLLANQNDQVTKETVPLEPGEAPIGYANDVDIEIGPEHAGAIVIIDQTVRYGQVTFGSPHQLSRVGRVLFGQGAVWSDPIELRVSPLILTEIPKGTTRMRVHVTPPLTYHVQRLIQPEPLG